MKYISLYQKQTNLEQLFVTKNDGIPIKVCVLLCKAQPLPSVADRKQRLTLGGHRVKASVLKPKANCESARLLGDLVITHVKIKKIPACILGPRSQVDEKSRH